MEWVESRKSHNLSRMDRTGASQVVLVVKNPPANAGDQVCSLGQEDPLGEGMVTYSSILVWIIPWTEEPCRLL